MAKRKFSDDLQALKEFGFNVPDVMENFIREIDYHKSKDIEEVWMCKCGKRYESPIHITEAVCPCGESMRIEWKRPLEGFSSSS
jgi:hypothetical protein